MTSRVVRAVFYAVLGPSIFVHEGLHALAGWATGASVAVGEVGGRPAVRMTWPERPPWPQEVFAHLAPTLIGAPAVWLLATFGPTITEPLVVLYLGVNAGGVVIPSPADLEPVRLRLSARRFILIDSEKEYMESCTVCDSDVSKRAFRCNGCGSVYCTDHRHGRDHGCPESDVGYEIINPEREKTEQKKARERAKRTERLQKQHAKPDPSRWWIPPAIVTWGLGYGTVALILLGIVGVAIDAVVQLPRVVWLVAAVPLGILFLIWWLSTILSWVAFIMDPKRLRNDYSDYPNGQHYILAAFIGLFILPQLSLIALAVFYHFHRRSKIGAPKPLYSYLSDYLD